MGERKSIEKARGDLVSLDDRPRRPGHVDEGEDVRRWIELAELLEHTLAAAQAGEPVVHQRDLHAAASR